MELLDAAATKGEKSIQCGDTGERRC